MCKKKIKQSRHINFGFIQISENETHSWVDAANNDQKKELQDFFDKEKEQISMVMAYLISQNISWLMDQSIRVRENNSIRLGWMINRLLQVTYMRMEIIDFIVFLINSGAFEAAATYVALTSVCMFIRTLIYGYRFITHMRLWYMLGSDYWYMYGDNPDVKCLDPDKILGCFGNELFWFTLNSTNLVYNIVYLTHHTIQLFASTGILSTNFIFTAGYFIDFMRDLIRDLWILHNIRTYGIYQGRTVTGEEKEKAIRDQYRRLLKQTITNFGMLCGRLLMSAAWFAMIAGKTTILMFLLPLVTTLFSAAFFFGFIGLTIWAFKNNRSRTEKGLAIAGVVLSTLLVTAAALSFVLTPIMAITELGIVAAIAIGGLVYAGYQLSRHKEISNKKKWAALAMFSVIAFATVPTLALVGIITLPIWAMATLGAVAAISSGAICYALLRKCGVENEAAIRFSIEVGSVLSAMVVGFTIAVLLTCPLTAPIILVPIFAALILFACRAFRKFDLLGNKDKPDNQDIELYSFNENVNSLFHHSNEIHHSIEKEIMIECEYTLRESFCP